MHSRVYLDSMEVSTGRWDKQSDCRSVFRRETPQHSRQYGICKGEVLGLVTVTVLLLYCDNLWKMTEYLENSTKVQE